LKLEASDEMEGATVASAVLRALSMTYRAWASYYLWQAQQECVNIGETPRYCTAAPRASHHGENCSHDGICGKPSGDCDHVCGEQCP